MKFLQGIRVVELATVLAGPEVGRFLAELGAEVFKFERPAGDMTRQWREANEPDESRVSAYFASVNAGKSYGQIDLKTVEGRNVLHRELSRADVLITNFREESHSQYGLEALRQKYPRLIWGSITGFAKQQRPAFDAVLQAETGWMSIGGEPGARPLKMPVAIIDIIAAHQLKEAILLGLLQREKSGEGSYWTVSLEEASLSALANQATNFWMNHNVPKATGGAHPNIAPYGDLLPTKDGDWVVPAVGSDTQFEKFCRTLGVPHLPEDDRFRNNALRVAHRAELTDLLSSAARRFTAGNLSRACIADNIPLGVVKTLDEVLNGAVAMQLAVDEKSDGRETRRVRSFIARQRG